MRIHRQVLFLPLLALAGCESGPQPPAKGTPAFYWAAAGDTFKTGDYVKTIDHLGKLTTGEFADRAAPWRLLLISGLAQGYAEMADRFETGARANKNSQGPFRKQVSDYRSLASRLSLDFAETLQKFEKTEGDVQLDFTFPPGNTNVASLFGRVAEGLLPSAAELEPAQKQALERAVLLSVARGTGSGDDTAKAREVLKTPPAKLPRAGFMKAMAQASLEQADMYGKLKLNMPDRFKFFCDHATDLAKKLPEGKDTKELVDRIQAAVKKNQS